MGDAGGRGGPALSAPTAAPPRAIVRLRPAAAAWLASLGTRVDRLFAGPAPPGISWPGAALGVAAVGLGTVVSLWRQPGVGALNTVWAEDGTIFLSDAVRRSTVDALSTSYAGYFHLVPRLLAEVASLAPARWAAAVLAVSAALMTALIALLVYVASAGHLTSRLSRVLVSAVVVVLPLGADDLPNSIANLHWPGLYALFWMLIWVPRGRSGRILAAVVVFLVAASDILTMIFVPLALVRALRRPSLGRRDLHGTVLVAALGVGVALQVLGLLVGSSSRALSPDPVRAVTGYVVRAVPSALIGERWLGPDVNARWLALAGLAWVLVAAALIAAGARMTRPLWPLAVAALVHSAALYALPVLLSGTATPRYAAAPAMLLATALAALLQPREGPRGRAPLYALAALCAVVWAVNLRMDNVRALGPGWIEEMRAARAECIATGASTVSVKVGPVTADWHPTFPCNYVHG